MTFRGRMLVAFAFAALVPLLVLSMGLRAQLQARVATDYTQRADATARVAREDLARESAGISARLAAIAASLTADDEFRRGAARGDPDKRAYVLDYAGRAMQVAGLAMLQIQDSAGRIISSGHFRNEFDRPDAEALRAVTGASDTAMLLRVRTPERPLLALVRADSFRVGGRMFFLLGGVAADVFIARAQRGDSARVAWDFSSAVAAAPRTILRVVPVRYADAARDGELQAASARLAIVFSSAELDALQRSLNRWFLAAIAVVAICIVALATWLSARLSAPLDELAQATARIDLDGDDVRVSSGRDDEIGIVARRLGALASRLRASASRLRDAERRATTGDMARQVNHDIKNGLIPIRNVLRHLGEVTERDPAALAGAFAERRGTLDASVEYLDTLARNYARLTPRVSHAVVDVNAVARDAVRAAHVDHGGGDGGDGGDVIRLQLAPNVSHITGDAVILRRILDNLIRNALESLDATAGSVVVETARRGDVVSITVADTGRGMSSDECARAFDDFFTTKEHGTGLGLSVVRRLTTDLRGTIRLESEPARGTTFTLEFPV